MTFPVEPVSVARTAATVYALVDPRESKVYLTHPGADIQRGDVLGFRGVVRRVNEPPEMWLDGGLVVPFEDAPPFMPDLGTLYRSTAGHFDTTTNEWLEPSLTPIWTGPCLVKAESVLGGDVEVTDQKITTQPFSITVPLDLTDVRADDVFKVTTSRDHWLTTRKLTVVRVEGSTEELGRVVRAIDNQG